MTSPTSFSWARRAGASCLLVGCVGTAMALGPSGGPFDLSWNSFDGGGGSPSHGASLGGGFALSGTIGQQDATPGNVLTGVSGRDTYTLVGGFWAIPVEGGSSCLGDLNGDGFVDGADLGLLLAQWQLDGNGDLNGDNFVDGADLGLLLSAWGPCP